MRSVLWCCLIISLGSCIDTIEIDLPQNAVGRMAVAGVVERSRDDYRFRVDVNRTQDLEDPNPTDREKSDISLLLDGGETLKLINGESLIFPIDSFHAVFGGSVSESSFNILVRTSGRLRLYISRSKHSGFSARIRYGDKIRGTTRIE